MEKKKKNLEINEGEHTFRMFCCDYFFLFFNFNGKVLIATKVIKINLIFNKRTVILHIILIAFNCLFVKNLPHQKGYSN